MRSTKPILITGGHMTPAISVLQALRDRGYDNFIWVGQKYSQGGATTTSAEFKTVSTISSVKFINLTTGKLARNWRQGVRDFLVALYDLLLIPYGFLIAFFIVLRHRPSVVVSFGGFLALPIVICARLFRVPILTHEQTVITGLANRIIAKFADKVLVAWEQSTKYYDQNKVIVTGNPVRRGLFKQEGNSISLKGDLPVLYITGGNQGAEVINTRVFGILPKLLQEMQIVHQTGNSSGTLELLAKLNLEEELNSRYHQFEYISEEQLGEVYGKLTLMVSRAGANTAYEALMFGLPTIFIPIPWVSGNEQLLNAKLVAETGLGYVLPQAELGEERLLTVVERSLEFLSQGKNLTGSGNIKDAKSAGKALVKDNADRLIADLVEQAINK